MSTGTQAIALSSLSSALEDRQLVCTVDYSENLKYSPLFN